MRKILTGALFVSMFLSFPTSSSFAKTINPVHSNKQANSYLGYIVQGIYTISIFGDLATNIVSSANVYETTTGNDIAVDFIQNGGVFNNNGVINVNIKVYTISGRLIRVAGNLTP